MPSLRGRKKRVPSLRGRKKRCRPFAAVSRLSPGEHERRLVIQRPGDIGIGFQQQAYLLVVGITAEVEDEAIGWQVVAPAQGGAFPIGGARVEAAVGGDGDGADARGGNGELLLDIGGGGGGIGEQQIGAAGGRADQGYVEALPQRTAVARQHEGEHIMHGADERHGAAQRRRPIGDMRQVRAATGDEGREAALLKIDFAERPTRAGCRQDFDFGGEVRWWRQTGRQDEREAKAGVCAEQGGQQLEQVAAAADMGLPGEPAVDGDVHGGIVA